MACLLTKSRAEVCKEFVGGIKSIYFINYGDLGAITYDGISPANPDITDQIKSIAGTFSLFKYDLKGANSFEQTITNVDQARSAVDLYTKALVAQAITSRYIDEIANKTIALSDANKRILETGREYYKVLEMTTKMSNGYSDASIVQAGSIAKAKELCVMSPRMIERTTDMCVGLS